MCALTHALDGLTWYSHKLYTYLVFYLACGFHFVDLRLHLGSLLQTDWLNGNIKANVLKMFISCLTFISISGPCRMSTTAKPSPWYMPKSQKIFSFFNISKIYRPTSLQIYVRWKLPINTSKLFLLYFFNHGSPLWTITDSQQCLNFLFF